jgi:1-acyl-sn-glycerol-3-phosphate acyltransferase
MPLEAFRDRKNLALKSEHAVRKAVLGILRGRPGDAGLVPVEPGMDERRGQPAFSKTEKWT